MLFLYIRLSLPVALPFLIKFIHSFYLALLVMITFIQVDASSYRACRKLQYPSTFRTAIDVAKTVVLERLKKDDTLDDRSDLTLADILTALNLCLDNTNLYFRGKFYRQIFGVAMGSPVSVIIANLVMENVQEGAMSTFLNPPKFWRRYVDDTFVIIKKSEVDEFHNHINNIEASIKFTIEHETNNSIPFLNVCITREASGRLNTKIYKKPTHTDRYLDFNSAHSISQKQGPMKCLLKRAQSQLNSKGQINH